MSDQNSADALLPGTVIGGYVIRRILGQGGFGITYEAASQTGFVERRVAIKEFFPEKIVHRVDGSVVVSGRVDKDSYNAALRRFESEAQKLIDFYDHPCIVRGENVVHAHGSVFFIMEFLEGDSLHDYVIAQGSHLREPELRGLLNPVLDAVEHIHAHGAMHRDLSPKNIMVRKRRRNRDVIEPVLIDFGALGEGIDTVHDSTIAVANPSYAPPEQQSPEGAFQGRFTDIFALAGVIYYCATGRTPVRPMVRLASTATGGRADPYVSLENAVMYREDYSPTFFAGVDAALQLRSDLRPQTIAEFREALGWGETDTASRVPPRSAIIEPSEEATQIFGANLRPKPASGPTANPPVPPPHPGKPIAGPPKPLNIPVPPRPNPPSATPPAAALVAVAPAAVGNTGDDQRQSSSSGLLVLMLLAVAVVAVVGGIVVVTRVLPAASDANCSQTSLVDASDEAGKLKSWIDSCSATATTNLLDAARDRLAGLNKPGQNQTATKPPVIKPPATDPQPGTIQPARPKQPSADQPVADNPTAKPPVADPKPTGPIRVQDTTARPAQLAANETFSSLIEQGATAGSLLTSGTKVVWMSPEDIAKQPQGADIVFAAKIDYPTRFLIDLVMRRNTKDILSASHVIELKFTIASEFTGKGIAKIQVPSLKKTNLPNATLLPIAGTVARISNNQFLVVLPSTSAVKASNIKLFSENRWMEIVLVYEDGRSNTLVFSRPPDLNP